MRAVLSRLLARCAAPFRFARAERELDEELQAHLAQLEDDFRQRGFDAAEARRQARLALGGVTQLREAHRDIRGLPLLESTLADLRYAVRGLRRNPGFTVVTVMVLAIGIGANAAMFSVLYGVLLQPLGYPDADRLVSVARNTPGGTEPRWISLRRLESMRNGSRAFTGIGAFLASGDQVAFSGDGEPEMLRAARVSANFLDVVGVRPALGRVFRTDEDAPGASAVALISTELWTRRFAGDRTIVGRSIRLNTVPHTIVGVLPAGFRFPASGTEVWLAQPAQSITVPAQFHRCCVPLMAFGRLRPGVSLDQADAELRIVSDRYTAANPAARRLEPGVLRATPWREELTAGVTRTLWMLLATVGVVLLIGCANVATLMMARATGRSGEFAVRAALGAGRGRLVRQLLTESLVLAACGGVLGLALARGAILLVTRMTIFDLPRADEIELSAPVLAFTGLVAIATGLVFGALPALQTLRHSLADRLRQSGPVTAPARWRAIRMGFSARSALIAAQVALSLVLLIGAGLLLKSMARIAGVDPGIRSAGMLTIRLPLAPARYNTDDARTRFFDDVARRVRALPGVTSVAVMRSLPTTGGMATNIQIQGEEIPDPGHMSILLQTVSPQSLAGLGMRLQRGRDLTERDNATGAKRVALINEAFARRVWSGYPERVDPIGRGLEVPILDGDSFEIVGIVADVRQSGPSREAGPQFYLPTSAYPPQAAYLAVRAGDTPLAVVDAVRRAVLAVDREQPLQDVRLMTDMLEKSDGQRHLATRLVALFAGTALLLAVVGIYGLLAYAVTQRTREIGVRRAFGAGNRDIVRAVLRQALGVTAVGIAAGLLAARAFTRLLETLLFDVSRTDAATFAGVSAAFLVVALAASLIPAWRAIRIDPMSALRV